MFVRRIQIVVVLVAMLTALVGCRTAQGETASAAAHRLVAAGAPLVDVRSPEEFAQGHIDGAKNIPVQEIPQRVDDVGPRDRPVVVYCASGRRSARAASLLRDAGFTAVHDLGPMNAW